MCIRDRLSVVCDGNSASHLSKCLHSGCNAKNSLVSLQEAISNWNLHAALAPPKEDCNPKNCKSSGSSEIEDWLSSSRKIWNWRDGDFLFFLQIGEEDLGSENKWILKWRDSLLRSFPFRWNLSFLKRLWGERFWRISKGEESWWEKKIKWKKNKSV